MSASHDHGRTTGPVSRGSIEESSRYAVAAVVLRLCEGRIFTERLPGITAPWARKTARLAGRLTALGLALGPPPAPG